MYFEIYSKGNLIKRGTKTLNNISFDNELMYVPSCEIELPIDWLEYFDGWEEVKIYINNKVFWGIVWDIEVDKVSEIISLTLEHVVSEWQWRQISVNHAISNENLNIVYKGNHTTTSDTNDETITANDFSVMAKRISKMTLADWIEKANATAWVTSNGDKVTITSVDTSKVKKEEGTYKVTFKTAKGTSVTVDCEVETEIDYQSQKTQSNKTNKETIVATPFTAHIDLGLTADKVKELVKADAWVYRHKNQKVSVATITTNFTNQVGKYTVTASTAKGTSITVNVEITNGSGSGTSTLQPSVVDKLEDIYNDKNFAYPGWEIDMQDDSPTKKIDYVYSRQNKLEALTQTMELTDDLWWRTGFWNERKIEIGKFGKVRPYIFSTKPSGETNIRIIEEPVIEYDFENVINVATVYSDKSDSGMSSLTLREVYNDKSLQKSGFPVVILHANVNNERDYTKYITQFPALAPNNELEFAVLDEASIALEQGTVIEGTYSFNDLNPFETDSNIVTDAKRVQAAKTVYEATIKKLIQARRSYDITLTTEELPADLMPGDKVRLLYDNRIWNLEACSSYWKKILSMDDYFYVTRIEYEIDNIGNEINRVTLTKWLKIDRETRNN